MILSLTVLMLLMRNSAVSKRRLDFYYNADFDHRLIPVIQLSHKALKSNQYRLFTTCVTQIVV